jgi:hypothetical protein
MAQTQFTGPVKSLNGFISGTATSPITVTTAQNIDSAYATTTAATGDTRLSYARMTFNGAGAGETSRVLSRVTAAQGAGQTTNGAHISLSINTGGTISGAANALRATLGVASGVTPGGTLAAIQIDSDIASGVTVPGSAAFIRVTNSNTTALSNLMNIPTAMLTNSTATATKGIRFVDSGGTAYYILCAAV